MFVERFAAWAKTASVEERCDALERIVEALFDTSIDTEDYDDCEQVLSLALSDRSDDVRFALAVALAERDGAPHHLLWALCDDKPTIAAQVFARSSHFRQSDLVDAIAGDDAVQTAIAGRSDIGANVVRTLVDNGCRDAVRALLANPSLAIGPSLKDVLATRFATDPDIRASLLDFQDIAPATRLDLTLARLEALGGLGGRFACGSRRMETVLADARDRAVLTVAECAGPNGMADYVAHLRAQGRITPALLVRAACENHAALFEHAIAELTGLPVSRVQSVVDSGRTVAFQALYIRTGLPAAVLPALLAAIDVWGAGRSCDAGALLDRSADADSATMRLLARIDSGQRRDAWQPAERQLAIAA